MAMIRDLKELNASIQEEKERIDTVDAKIVSFSLGGKDYGVDIMNVKEIAKADKFTFVPNAASFVRGVYNLRGDIIPIIDLRSFFHMPVENKKDNLENMLILRIEDRVYGTIVDRIDKVVGINSETIQPPHPIFGDINIKYISGVVEKNGDLYIILDVIRIFSHNEEEKQKSRSTITEAGDNTFYTPPAAAEEPVPHVQADNNIDFIKESLPQLTHFYPSGLNEEWIRRRYADWSGTRSGEDLQLTDLASAEEYISAFYSPCTGRFWDDDYASMVRSVLPDMAVNSLQVWNPGCGKGFETFSLACVLKSRYPGTAIKIWANDNDIMSISGAPNMVFDTDDMPEYCRKFLVKGRNGYSFNQEIKDSIVFEYHDIQNENPLPDLDIIFTRDLLSFFKVTDQQKLIADFAEKTKSRGMIFTGRNEILPEEEWLPVGRDPVSAFVKND
ncbi:MAG: chemotaxis protein CheW [Treponema sp.]|nr:chemotaxis protein CheW [Treponema sp.]